MQSMAKPLIKRFLFHSVLSIIIFYFLARILFSAGGKLFLAELAFLAGAAFIFTVFVVLYFLTRWGERVIFFFYLVNLANLVFLGYIQQRMHLLILLTALIGFVFSLIRKERKEELQPKQENVISDVLPEAESIPKETEKPIKTAPVIKEEFKPGKFVASQNSTYYHQPKCDWAKKINRKRRVWFYSKEEAEEKGYKQHNCK